jgi:hypothetical protein
MKRSHVVPTHLRTPETILTLGGVSLSVRQFVLLLCGTALGYNLWLRLGVLATFPGGQFGRGLIALMPVLLALALAFMRLAGRTLDRWLVVLLLYQQRPKRLVWRSVRWIEPSIVLGEFSQEENHE